MPGAKAKALLRTWRRQWAPLLFSLLITLASLFIYRRTFVGEQASPAFEFFHRLELASLDMRFQIRGTMPADPRIAIVAIDQKSQEEFGRWPFPRKHFAALLDRLREDGARVVAFDIAFTQPDQTAAPLRELQQQLGNSGVARAAGEIAARYDYDRRFAEAIERSGNVVLGNFFFFDAKEARALDAASRQERDDLLENFALPEVRVRPGANSQTAISATVDGVKEFFGAPLGAEVNLRPLIAAAAKHDYGMGFFNIRADPDGVVRHTVFALPYAAAARPGEWNFYPSLDVQVVRAFLGAEKQRGVLNLSETGIENLELGDAVTVRSDETGQAVINYRGDTGRTYPFFSLADVAQGRTPAGTFRDKIVLVGATAIGIGDLRATPYGRLNFPGIEIRANTIDNILHGDFIQRGARQNRVDEWLIFLFGVPLGLWLAVVRPRYAWFSILLLVPFSGAVIYAFEHGWWLNAVMPALFTLVPNTIVVALYRVVVEEREKRRIRGAFQQYVSPEVIRRLLDNPALVNPRKVEITTIFSDIRGFTTLAERLDAQRLALLLNQYLTEMTRIVFRNRGTLDKFIGDALMAFWGAPFEEPGHAARACRGALEMLARLDSMRKQWQAEGSPIFDIGVGINTGIAAVGNMGSQLRYGYTAMGDSVNLASRLEGLNKIYGTRILATEFTVAAVQEQDGAPFYFRELDLIRVKGKQQPARIFELAGLRDQLTSEMLQRFEVFAEGRRLYTARDWSGAKRCFDKLYDDGAGDGAARLFAANCAKCMIVEPPADWDGVFTMEHK